MAKRTASANHKASSPCPLLQHHTLREKPLQRHTQVQTHRLVVTFYQVSVFLWKLWKEKSEEANNHHPYLH